MREQNGDAFPFQLHGLQLYVFRCSPVKCGVMASKRKVNAVDAHWNCALTMTVMTAKWPNVRPALLLIVAHALANKRFISAFFKSLF